MVARAPQLGLRHLAQAGGLTLSAGNARWAGREPWLGWRTLICCVPPTCFFSVEKCLLFSAVWEHGFIPAAARVKASGTRSGNQVFLSTERQDLFVDDKNALNRNRLSVHGYN